VTDFERLLAALNDGGVTFIVVGGFAATAHGSAHVTIDLDVVYARTPENISRLSRALKPFEPYLRGAPAGLPFRFDVATIERGLNFRLRTTVGDLDLLGEATGSGTYEGLLAHTERRQVFGRDTLIVDLETLIRLKRAAGRPKDLERIAELEAIADERNG
jgi:predicted nucleotidyltransferase